MQHSNLQVEIITVDITSAIDCDAIKIPAKEFCKLYLHVHILTRIKSRARKIWQCTHKLNDKIKMNRAQEEFKNFLYEKCQQNQIFFSFCIRPFQKVFQYRNRY